MPVTIDRFNVSMLRGKISNWFL